MSKSRSFSIYLLKEGFHAGNALKEDHRLDGPVPAASLPQGASLYVLDSPPRIPWWRDYFGIRQELRQVTKGALIFLPVDGRCFALSFGHVHHNLKDVSYEYDFGLRVTLNSVDPKKLKSTDVLEPGASRRQRTQVPVESDLTYFDFDRDSSILRRLTGTVKGEHRELFRHATGASNLRISSHVAPEQLPGLCQQCLALYDSDDYRTTFPNIQNIVPVKDPSIIAQLDAALVAAFCANDERLHLSVPDMINYHDNVYASFSGTGRSKLYDDVFISRYYEYLAQHERAVDTVGISELRSHSLVLRAEDESRRESYIIYKCLIFDTTLPGDDKTYHLCEGEWYAVDESYMQRIDTFLDSTYSDLQLPEYNHGTEGAYNASVAANDNGFICLDRTDISPSGETEVEPCDLYAVDNESAIFYHVKISTLSRELSHLFNQGLNSLELIRLENSALEKLKTVIVANANGNDHAGLLAPLERRNHNVIFAIVTHKDRRAKSKNLPLFSRISLMRSMKTLQLMGVPASFGFIADKSPKKDGRKKPSKKEAAARPGEVAA